MRRSMHERDSGGYRVVAGRVQSVDAKNDRQIEVVLVTEDQRRETVYAAKRRWQGWFEIGTVVEVFLETKTWHPAAGNYGEYLYVIGAAAPGVAPDEYTPVPGQEFFDGSSGVQS